MLLRLLSWPYARRHVLRTMLTAAGITLGVSVFVAMHTANQSVLFAFRQTVDRIAGKTELQVTAGEAGFAEEILDRVQSAATVRVAVPVIEAVVDASIAGEGSLLVVGVDMTGDRSLREYELESGDAAVLDDPLIFLAQPDSIMLAEDFTQRNGLSVGDRVPLGTAEGEKTFTVRGILKPAGLATAFGGNIVIMDVYAAQKMFGRGRTFDRIDLAMKSGVTVDEAQRELATLLGPAFDVSPPATRGRQFEAMLGGYSMMVTLSSAFALFIGMFIIYNAFAIAVTQRRAEIGILRALGATRGQIGRLFLIESALLGVVGSLAGLALGVAIAQAIAASVSSLVSDVYGVAQHAAALSTDSVVLGIALVVGIATSVAAAALPARNAARVDPVQALQKGKYQVLSAGENRLRVAGAIVLALIAAGCLVATTSRTLFYVGYGLTIIVAVLLAPVLALMLARAMRPVMLLLRPVEGALAADSLIQAPRRTSAAVTALMLSLALIVAFAGTARASSGSIIDWMDVTLNPDLFVMPSQRLDIRSTRFPSTMASEIAAVTGVERVQMFRNSRITFRDRPVMVVAIEMSSVAQTSPRKPVSGTTDEMYRTAAAGTGVIVSDNLAQLHNLELGDIVDISAPHGALRLPITGVIVDYTDQQGSILMDRSVYTKYWGDDTVSDFRVYLRPDANRDTVRHAIIERYAGRRQVFVLTNEEARQYITRLTDQWFGLMNVQVAVAVLVAILGIVNTLTVSITDRRRELGVLQAVGALRGQVRRTIWMESLAIASIALLLGYALGAINLAYMLEIVRRDVAGMRLEYVFPVATALALVPAILGAGFIAALWPAESAVRGSLVEALEYE